MAAGLRRALGAVRLDAAWRALALAGVVAVAHSKLGDRAVDLDVFHQMALARETLGRGALPLADGFAFTPTVFPVVHHEWGTGFVLHAVHSALGLPGLGLLRIALFAAVAALAYGCARLRGARAPIALLAAPLALAVHAAGLSPVRAQAFTFVLFAALLLLLELDRHGRRAWIAPWLACQLVWVNLHGGAVIGLAAVGLHATERVLAARRAGVPGRAALAGVRHLALVGLAMAAAFLATPYGLHYPTYLWRALTMPRPLVTEWAPLWRAEPTLLAATALSFLALALVLVRRGTAAPGALTAAVFGAAAVAAQRNVALYAIAWFTAVAPGLSRTALGPATQRAWRRRPALFAAAGALLVAAEVRAARAVTPPWALEVASRGGASPGFPVEAVRSLRARGFSGNLLTTFESGAYVSWELHPAVKVSLDSRYEAAYPPGLVEEHRAFHAGGPGWDRILDRYPVDAILVPARMPAARRLRDGARAGWALVHADPAYEVWERRATDPSPPTPARASRR